MSTKLNSIYSNVIICFILTPFLTLPLKPLYLPFFSYRTPNESLMSVCCVCADLASLSHTCVIESIESKLILVCLINDYFLIA